MCRFQVIAVLALWFGVSFANEPLTLVTQGRSTYSIVISERASPIEQKAAHEFQRLLELSTQVNLPIVASPPKGSFEILIGQAAKNYTKDKQESNLLAPFPNLDVLQPNIQYFSNQGVNAHFQQGNISRGGEFSELKPYLIAKLLWNPDIDLEQELSDFLDGYYESAAPYIHEYINLIHDELNKSNIPLTIYGNPTDHLEGFLSPELWVRYDDLFNLAEKAVSSDRTVLNRVKLARLPLSYALFESAKKLSLKESRVFEQRNDSWVVKPQLLERVDDFLALCEKNKIIHLAENSMSPGDYIQQLKEFLSGAVLPH